MKSLAHLASLSLILLVAISGCNSEALPEADEDPTKAADIDEESTDSTSSAATALTRTAKFYSKQQLPICNDPVPALVPSNVGINFYVWRGPNTGCYQFNILEAKRQAARAKCHHVKNNNDSCNPAFVYGEGSGGTESQACQAAIRDAQGKSSPGCHTRHCRCL